MREILDKISTGLLIILMTVMVLSALLQVTARVFGFSAPFTEELTIYSMMWVTLFGSAYTFGIRKHISIDILEPQLSERNQHRLRIAIEGVILVFTFLILIFGGVRFSWITAKLGQVSAVMNVPKWYVYLALPLSGLIVILYSILNIKDELNNKEA
ncbi:MAG: TRAP transporter small permease [Bacteroidota bacterium]